MTVDRKHFREILRRRGLKVTNQRIAILEILEESRGEHLTAEEIHERVKADYPELGLATVYRTVQLLVELHLVDSISLNDGLVRYEIGETASGGAKHRHHHLICVKCGKIQAFEDDLLEALEKRLYTEMAFQVIDHEVKFFGCCKECQEKAADRENDEKHT